MVEPLVSVVVCTYNRKEFLVDCIESLKNQKDAPPYEILVIDNRSTDGTAELIRKLIVNSPVPAHYIFEGKPGLSRARNRGVEASAGLYLAFIDDDAIASQGWVRDVWDGFEKFPNVAAQMGPVEGRFEAKRPSFIGSDLDFVLSLGSLGTEYCIVPPNKAMLGCNMAFHRKTFEQIGGFSEELGRIGTSLLAAEEVEFQERLNKYKFQTLYNPHMLVHHWVPKDRLSSETIYRRMSWNGRSIAIWNHSRKRPIILHTLGRIFYAIPRDSIWMLLKWAKEDKRFYYSCQLKKHFGYVCQVLEIITQPTKTGEI